MNKAVKREKYLNKIRPLYNEELIKVITGMRRVGKSTILKQVIDELIDSGVKEKRIIEINFELLEFEELLDYKLLNKYLESKITDKQKHYIFIDEIQNVDSFEKVINSINTKHNVSIFITGSNSNLLSGELATILSGRYREIRVYPYSYNEWLEAVNAKANKDSLERYIYFGGLPQVANINNDQDKIELLRDILNSIIYKDIISRTQVRNNNILNKLIGYIIQNTSLILSIKSIVNYFKTVNIDVTPRVIYDYLEHISNSFLVSECKKNNVKGKVVLTQLNKLYLNDLGLKVPLNGNAQIDHSKKVETIIYNHLKMLGYEITYGSIGNYEIDFIATKITPEGLVRKYIQATHLLNSEETIEREFRPFKELEDGYERYIISNDEVDYSREGIKHIYLGDFLTNDEF